MIAEKKLGTQAWQAFSEAQMAYKRFVSVLPVPRDPLPGEEEEIVLGQAFLRQQIQNKGCSFFKETQQRLEQTLQSGAKLYQSFVAGKENRQAELAWQRTEAMADRIMQKKLRDFSLSLFGVWSAQGDYFGPDHPVCDEFERQLEELEDGAGNLSPPGRGQSH